VAARVLACVVAMVSGVAVWVAWRLFVDTGAGQQLERAALAGAVYGQGKLWSLAEPVLDIVSVSFVVLGLGVAMGIALIRRRWWLAVQVAVLVAGANLSTQLLKHNVLDRVDLIGAHTGHNSLPSGHTTVAASVSMALLLVVPRTWRAVVAVLGGAYTAATGVSTLIGQWHRPADVVAALFVVLAWTAAVCAFTPASARDRAPAATGTGVVATVLLAGGAVAGALAAVAAARVSPVSWATTDAAEATAYIGGALGVVAVTAVTFAVALAVRQATARPLN
jgi:membrane-associated phospholipid phosphatase